MFKGKTTSGFSYEIDERILDDYELVEMVANIDDDFTVFPKLLNKLLGKKQMESLKSHVKNSSGYVSIEKMTEELFDIFGNSEQLKK